MRSTDLLLLKNKSWAQDKLRQDIDFFSNVSKGHSPEFLWIGCSDSRVPAEVIVNAEPGEMFIHRNIANQMVPTDINSLSVLQFAVNTLKVKNIIVCGHYNCGGVNAALSAQNPELSFVNKWLMHIKDIYKFHKDEIEKEISFDEKVNRLVEFNVMAQVDRLSHTAIVQKAWKSDGDLTIHGWVYAMEDGILKELITMDCNSPIDQIYQHEFQ